MKKWVVLFLWSTILSAQIGEPVEWQTKLENIKQNVFVLTFEAKIESKWHLYSQFSDPEGAIPTEFIFKENRGFNLIGPVQESEVIVSYDKFFEMDLTYFNNKATFMQKIEILDPNLNLIEVELNYQACDDALCVFRSKNFNISLDGSNLITSQKIDAKSKKLSDALRLELTETEFLEDETLKEGTYSYFNILLLGFIGGLLALLTPCVFPMIPLTVSFFLKQSISSTRGIFNALIYAFFIVLIYGILSLPFHFIDSLDPELLNTLATNVFLNLVFFLVFVIFAFSFFGFYDLTLPSSWGDKSDEASVTKGVIGIFFMALTLAIVSFSCTGPILGSLLAGSITSEGGATQLSIGMLGFGVALGLPFGLFALFPNTLKALPKSGSWMTTLKVILGFLELALALKILSNADLVGHFGFLKREIFIGIWTLLTFALTLYLFGIFRFPNEVKEPLSKIRYCIAGLSFILTSYLFLGLVSTNNTLKLLSGFPPPEFYSIRARDSDCPLGLECYKDYDKGKEVALSKGKPILLDFTGWACVNCRKMEENVWSEADVYSLLKEEYIIISLYVDDRKSLAKDDQFDFQYSNGRIKKINTIGKKWATFQSINFNTASQPFYVQITPEGTLLNKPIQYTDTKTFRNWLKTGLENRVNPVSKAKYFKF